MKKYLHGLIIAIISTIYLVSIVNAASIDSLKNNGDQYMLYYSNDTMDIYIDFTTIKTVRVQNPYFMINATEYSINYKQNKIYKNENSYFFNQNKRLINWRPNAITVYNLNGSINHNRISINDIKGDLTIPSTINSPAYIVATKLFQRQLGKIF